MEEKVWHERRYPKVVIDNEKCVKCGKCINICPVCHLKQDSNKFVIKNIDTQCIHCFNCIFECPQKAISPVGDLEKAKSFMDSVIKKAKEYPDTCLYPKI